MTRPLLIAATLLVFATAKANEPDSSVASLSKPNVLFIAIDDLNTCPDRMGGETVVESGAWRCGLMKKHKKGTQ